MRFAPDAPAEAATETELLEEAEPVINTAPQAATAALAAPALVAPPTFATPGLSPEPLPWRTKLLALLAAEQPWLEPELTLSELARRRRTKAGLLSKVINAGCGQNFNNFVNTYRVQEARRPALCPLLAGGRGPGMRVQLQIYFQPGV